MGDKMYFWNEKCIKVLLQRPNVLKEINVCVKPSLKLTNRRLLNPSFKKTNHNGMSGEVSWEICVN